ncbi:MAG: SAM hydrolase/SAM-dependent halogenase family protein, partial [Anaerolineae bacterium]
MAIITLLTDFGERDGYVGTMKGVILGTAPHVTLVDLSHDIPPQDIRSAAYVLWCSYRFFPPDTIHLVVVDPGVGTERRPIAVRTAHGFFVAPDNGVLGYVLEEERGWQAVHLTERRFWRPAVSMTFHGRDIFAPAAAHLAAGVPLHQLGLAITDPVQMPFPPVRRLDEARCQACLVYIDRFGNCVTNLPADYLLAGRQAVSWGPALSAMLGDHLIRGLYPTSAAVPPQQPLLLVGSSGLV